MNRLNLALATFAVVLLGLGSIPTAAAAENGQGQAVVTILPKNNSDAPVSVAVQNLRLKINGKDSTVTGFAPLHGASNPVELVILMDSSARASIGTQMGEIEAFVKEMPRNTKMTIGYMDSGRAVLSGPLSADPAQVLRGLHLPGGLAGQSASPYFCLSDLAKRWPSQDPKARREVLMITDGVDYYNLRYDPEDPYVLAAISDSAKAGLVVNTVYWLNQGRIDRTGYENSAGQNLLLEVTQATGGVSFWEGSGNPVSFDPYFKELRQRFEHQYLLTFSASLKGKPDVEHMDLKVSGVSAKVTAPQQVLVAPAGTNSGE